MRVDIRLVPPLRPPSSKTCLVVDVLRATSCIAVLLGRGAAAVYPVGAVEGAIEYRDALVPDALLCGEVRALPPEGFDYGNSPTEFAGLDAGVVEGRRFVVATTNGTPALIACSQAPLVLAAAPLNAAAVVDAAVEAGNDVLVVCAGLRGAAAEDDALAAGLLVSRLAARGVEPTRDALDLSARYDAVSADLASAFRETEHGGNLARLGFGADIDLCATSDLYGVVGVLTARPEGWALLPHSS